MALVEQDQQSEDLAPTKAERDAPTALPPRERGEDKPAEASSTFAVLRRHPWLTVLGLAIVAAVAAAVVVWWLNARNYETTDDAFIDTRIVSISAQVTGQIVAVPVTDNQRVKTGAPLVRTDPRDYRAALAQANAQLAQAHAHVANLGAQIDAQQAKVDSAQKAVTQAQGALKFSEQEQRRYQDLLKRGAGTVQRAQQAQADLTQKRAAFAGAQANATATEKQLVVLRTQRESARAAVDAAQAGVKKAKIDVGRTSIEAPVDGRVAKLTAAVGAYAQPGQALMSIVPEKVWVTANFKETQLNDIRVGQPVDIAIDAYPGKTFHGHVDSIQAGSGAAFSLLPAENATGNFVKVVQRVPVKIVFDDPPDVYLGPGMSVVPSVKVR